MVDNLRMSLKKIYNEIIYYCIHVKFIIKVREKWTDYFVAKSSTRLNLV